MGWYTELYDLIEQRLVYANIANVGPAMGFVHTLPSVEPWIGGSYEPDEQVSPPGQIGDLRKVLLGVKITVAKNAEDGGAMRQAYGLLDQVETSLKTWVLPVTGIIRTGGNRRKDAPQLIHKESAVKDFNSDGECVIVVIFTTHLYVDKFEVKQ